MKPARATIRIFIWVMFGWYVFGCSDRDRSNPLDPHNPATQGRPYGLSAYSMERQVVLRWPPLEFKDLEAIFIYRRTADDSPFSRIGQTLASSFIDHDVAYGKRYEYYITAFSGGYESRPSNVVHSTPGPTFTWISDYQAGSVVCLTHDLQAEVTRVGLLYYPQMLSVSPKERAAWVAVRYERQLYKINQNGQITASVPNMDGVVDIAVDTMTLDVWVARKNPAQLTRLDANGIVKTSTDLLHEPIAIALPPLNDKCWVLDNGDRRLKAFGLSGERLIVAEPPLTRPTDIVYAAHNRRLWIADSSSAIQYDEDGHRTGIKAEPFYFISLLAYDNRNHCLWAIDLERWGVPAKLIKMDDSGNPLMTVSVFSYPVALAVNEFDGSCLVGDSGYDHYGLYRVTNDGKVEEIGQFILPLSIAVEYH